MNTQLTNEHSPVNCSLMWVPQFRGTSRIGISGKIFYFIAMRFRFYEDHAYADSGWPEQYATIEGVYKPVKLVQSASIHDAFFDGIYYLGDFDTILQF